VSSCNVIANLYTTLTVRSRIPHGFYEHQMREYFSQFGTISKLRLSRNRRTGESKHFAFIEFESDEVAKIVANAMDNYLMFGHILKCKYAPQDTLHPNLWKGANKRFRKVPYTMLEKRALEAPKTSKHWEEKNAREQKKREQKAEKMKELGYDLKLPNLKEPKEVLQQRKLQNKEQQNVLEAVQEVQDVPANATEPPNGMPKDEVALKAEDKNKKKNEPAKQESTKSTAEATAPPQPAPSASERSHLETEKRDKRKEKKTKSKDAKAQQTQLDAQLLGDTEATVDDADAALKPANSTSVEAEKINETSAVNSLAIGDEKKRKRRKNKDAKAAATAMLVATQATKANAAAHMPKKKKHDSEKDAAPKGMLRKPSKEA
jgi:RNA recognition motif-containing protein